MSGALERRTLSAPWRRVNNRFLGTNSVFPSIINPKEGAEAAPDAPCDSAPALLSKNLFKNTRDKSHVGALDDAERGV